MNLCDCTNHKDNFPSTRFTENVCKVEKRQLNEKENLLKIV